MKFLFLLFPLVTLTLQECGQKQTAPVQTTELQKPALSSFIRDSSATIDSLDVVFYFPENAAAALTSTRPLKSDSAVVFCCAAAFTLLENDKIDGLFIENGTTKVSGVNHSLGGGIIIPPVTSRSQCVIFGTDMGKSLDSEFVDSVQAASCSFFQQIQMVRDGQALVFRKDVSKFQRRAICDFHGKTIIIESKSPCTLQKFAEIIKKCGIPNALYVDMGSWDEGWFRTQDNTIRTIGLMRNSTKRQSNWFVFTSKTAP